MTKIAFLSSSDAPHFQSLIEAKKTGRLQAELCCLITDKADCGAAKAARAASIRVYFFDARDMDPPVYDEQVLATLGYFKADLAVLDGFGRAITPELAQKFEGRWINLDTQEAAEQFVRELIDSKILQG
jgi:phosphoribosylglycinamide formyltransferase 1